MIEKLKGHIQDIVYNQLQSVIDKYNINTELRLAHFLGQCSHESLSFTVVTENLNYTSFQLKNVFPNYFKVQNPDDYAHNPEKIANYIYGSRMGNNGTTDGWMYRGRGYIQLTGKYNYTQLNKKIPSPDNVINNPELVSSVYPLFSSAWFWDSKNLNLIADLGDTDSVVLAVTKRINPGLLGLEDRIKKFNFYFNLLK